MASTQSTRLLPNYISLLGPVLQTTPAVEVAVDPEWINVISFFSEVSQIELLMYLIYCIIIKSVTFSQSVVDIVKHSQLFEGKSCTGCSSVHD